MPYEANHAKLCNALTKEEKIEFGSGNVFADLGFPKRRSASVESKVSNRDCSINRKERPVPSSDCRANRFAPI